MCYPSVMRYLALAFLFLFAPPLVADSYEELAAKGVYDYVNKYGYNDDLDQNVAEDLWSAGGTYIFSTTAFNFVVASTSIADDAGSTGALTLLVSGLDQNWDRASETVIMDGQTDVTSVGLYMRVFRAQVLTAGSGGQAAGNISISLNSNVSCFILAGEWNQSQMAIYTIPRNFTGLLMSYSCALLRGGTGAVDCQLYDKEQGEVFHLMHQSVAGAGSVSPPTLPFLPIRIPEKADVKLRGIASQNNSPTVGAFTIILIPKS